MKKYIEQNNNLFNLKSVKKQIIIKKMEKENWMRTVTELRSQTAEQANNNL